MDLKPFTAFFAVDPFGGAKPRSGSTLSVRLSSRRSQAQALRPGSRRVDVEGVVRSPRSLFVRLRTGALQHLGAWAGIVIPGQD